MDNISTTAAVEDNDYQTDILTPRLSMSEFKTHFTENGNNNINMESVGVRRSQRIRNQRNTDQINN